MTQRSTLTLSAPVPESRLASLTRDLSRDLVRSGIIAKTAEAQSPPDTRGDIVTLGQLALGLITSGAVTALIECLKAYIAREHQLTIKIKEPNGAEVEISSKNIDDPKLLKAMKDNFVGS